MTKPLMGNILAGSLAVELTVKGTKYYNDGDLN